MGEPSKRRVTRPGGTEEDRIAALWGMAGIDDRPDEWEQACLERIYRMTLMQGLESARGLLRGRVQWSGGFSSMAGDHDTADGFAVIHDGQVSVVYMAVYEGGGIIDDEYSVHESSASLDQVEDVAWEDTQPFPTISVAAERGVRARITDFAPDLGAQFFEALTESVEASWREDEDERPDPLAERRAALDEATQERGDPPQRLIRTPADAEEAAAAWMRWLGISDARATPAGPDEGIDVVSEAAVAQVKAQVVAIGRPDVQRLLGAAAHAEKRALFFSLGGYTQGAVVFANATDVALFTFDLQGQPEPVNDVATDFIRAHTPDDSAQASP